MRYCLMSDCLDDAINFATRTADTSNVLAFDGAIGGFNLTEPLVELLKSKAPTVEEKVENDLLPKWCRQRNLKLRENEAKGDV